MTWDVDFSIGPVQGFVAQSRRTRDLWGSSYLLSYLAAQAMHGAVTAGGEIVRPTMDNDPLYQWVRGTRPEPPRTGSVPNHFVVRTDAEPHIVATAATEAFRAAWYRVCDAVWQSYVGEVAERHGSGTEQIWQRQIEACWETVWVAGCEGGSAGLLARRKHWRTHRLPDEPGDKCTMMPDFQELSGYVRASKGATAQKEFWKAVQQRAGRSELRVEDDERLCAPALIKRLFAKRGRQAIGSDLDVERWPSTLYIGVVPWLHEVAKNAGEQARHYVEALRVVAEEDVVRHHVPVRAFERTQPIDFFKLDANYYHRARLASPRLCPLKDEGDATRSHLLDLLKDVYEAAGDPPAYYALLLADGDQLGRLVGDVGPDEASRALSTFAACVGEIVASRHGVTVYAGGDDVLAMLPLEGALRCADSLAIAYTQAFTGPLAQPATLSAAVLYVHARVPIGGALDQAHELLDEVAKEANGRDSLVAAVLKPGGVHCQWVTSWTRTYPGGREPLRAVDQLGKLTAAMSDEHGGRAFSTSLLHHTRDVLEILAELRRWKPGKTGVLPDGLDLRAYVSAELADSWVHRDDGAEPDSAELAALTSLVVDLLAPSYGSQTGDPVEGDGRRAGLDALLLAQFLAGGGREDEHA